MPPKKSTLIDRDSYEPAYAQLVKIIRQQIAAGQYRPGSLLPSEAGICRRYSVSPMTVRRAINLLLEQGVVRTVQGRGTFVQGVKLGTTTFDLSALRTLFEDNPETRVTLLEARIISADDQIAPRLEKEVGERIILIRRLLFKGQEPILYHHEYLVYDPRRPVVEAEMGITSLFGLFSGGGDTDIKKGFLAIKTAWLTEEEAGWLDTPAQSLAWHLEHTFYDFDDKPVAWGCFVCPATKLTFTAKIGLWDEI